MGMKILVLNWRDIESPEAGGAEVHLHEILKRAVAVGHRVTLVCCQSSPDHGPPETVIDGVRIVRVGRWWNAPLRIPRRAKQLLESESHDLVVDDVNKIPFFAPSWSGTAVTALFLHLLGGSVFMETNPIAASILWALERRVGRVYGQTPAVAISQSTAAELKARGYDPSRITVVPPGLNHDRYSLGSPEPSRDPSGEPPLIVVVSRLKRYKRIDVAIAAQRAIQKVMPKARMVVIGSGNDRRKLQSLASKLSANVEFLGHLPAEAKVEWLRKAQLVLNPSYKEGWGLVGIEAMACGTVVIASDVPGHRDSVPEGAGVLVPYGDSEAMALEAVRLLTDADLYRSHREAGLRWAQRFSWDRAAREILAVWEQVAALGGGTSSSTEAAGESVVTKAMSEACAE